MDISPIFLYFLPIATVVAVAMLGSTRRIGFWMAFVLAILLTPIGGFIVALVSGPRKPARSRRSPKSTQPAPAADLKSPE